MNPSGMAAEDAEDIAAMLLKMDRAVHPGKWVEDFMRQSIADHNAEQLKAILG